MAIKRLDTNKYKITIEVGFDVFGKRKRKTKIVYGSKEQAKKEESILIQNFYHIGKKFDINDLTFERFSKLYLEKYCKQKLSLITITRYEKLLIKINSIIGKEKITKITPLILDNMYAKLFCRLDGKQLSYNSKYDYYKLIRSMFNVALNWELVSNNPNNKINNKPKKEKKEKRFYDINQTNQLIKALENESIKNKAIIMLTLDSGIRRGELAALRWSDINFTNSTITISKSLKIVKSIVDEEKPKTESSKREIVISNSTIEILNQYKDWQNNIINKMGSKWINENRIFASANGKNMNPCSFNHILNNIIKKYKLPPLSFHELRHTSASILLNQGIDIKTISKRLGHSTSIVTDIYTHAFESSKMRCANTMDELFKNVQNC